MSLYTSGYDIAGAVDEYVINPIGDYASKAFNTVTNSDYFQSGAIYGDLLKGAGAGYGAYLQQQAADKRHRDEMAWKKESYYTKGGSNAAGPASAIANTGLLTNGKIAGAK